MVLCVASVYGKRRVVFCTSSAYLAKHTAKVTTTKKDTPRAVVALDEWFLAKVWRNCSHLDRLCTDQAHACLLVAVDAAKAGA